MGEAATLAPASECGYGFPAALAKWIARNGDLVDALLALRRLGADGVEAVSALLRVRPVAEVLLSWQLWEALTEGDGEDPETLLLQELSFDVVERARAAFWGPSWRDGEVPEADLRLVSR